MRARHLPIALAALALAFVAAPAAAQQPPATPVLLARTTLPGPVRPGLRSLRQAAATTPSLRFEARADREVMLQAAVGGALLGCAIGIFMGPEQGSAFGCAVGGAAGAGLGALMGSGL